MKYIEAVPAVVKGKRVARAHWCWVWLRYTPRRGLYLEHEDGKTERYIPMSDDRAATDWYEVNDA